MEKIIYSFDPTTGKYLDAAPAQLDPIDETPIIPAYSTVLKPPEAAEGYVIVFRDSEGNVPKRSADGSWEAVADNRGQYWDNNNKPVAITALGDEVPAGWTKHKPGSLITAEAEKGVETFHATVLEDLTGRKTDTEKLTWKSKEEAAIEFVTGAYQRALDQLTDPDLSETETAQAQHIVANHAIIADAVTGDGDDTVEREAQAILAKAAGYKKTVGVAEKLKSAAKAGIRALDPESETIQQDVDAVLDSVKAQAEAVKQQVKQQLQGA